MAKIHFQVLAKQTVTHMVSNTLNGMKIYQGLLSPGKLFLCYNLQTKGTKHSYIIGVPCSHNEYFQYLVQRHFQILISLVLFVLFVFNTRLDFREVQDFLHARSKMLGDL